MVWERDVSKLQLFSFERIFSFCLRDGCASFSDRPPEIPEAQVNRHRPTSQLDMSSVRCQGLEMRDAHSLV